MVPSEAGSRRIGRYHLSEPVGGGPTGEVFLAKIHGVAGLDRQFAIKRIHSALLASPENFGQLSSALRLYSGLEHPRIARLHEHKLEGTTPFIAVEWCAGIDLARLIDATFGQGRPLPAGAATSLISRAARAVGYAHGRGQTHLGLSPTNLICSQSGEIKVTDFGLLPARLGASPADDSTLLSRIPYLAPEQLSDEKCSPATDVFTLGSLFFELLSGNKAFVGRGGHDIAAAVHAAKPEMDAIPKPLARVLMRCLAHSPFERYPSGGALADAIDAAARGMLMRGDQRDAAKAVQEAKERLETMRRTQVSGALSFPMPAPPRNRAGLNAGSPSALGVPNLELDERVNENATTDVMMPKPAAAGHARVAAVSPTLAKTMMGAGPQNQRPQLASPLVGAPRTVAVFDDAQPTTDFQRVDLNAKTAGANDQRDNFDDMLGPQTVPFTRPKDRPGGAEPSDDSAEDLATNPAASRRSLSENIVVPAYDSSMYPVLTPESNHLSVATHDANSGGVNPATNDGAKDTEATDGEAVPLEISASSTLGTQFVLKPPMTRGRKILLAAIAVGVIAIVILALMIAKGGNDDGAKVASSIDIDAQASKSVPAKDAGIASVATDARLGTPTTPTTTTIRDAAPPLAADAALAVPSGSSDLVVTSKPSKATVYLDGTLIGKTPITVDSGSDSHKLVVIRAGYKLYVADTDGGEIVNVELEEVTPPGGRAGIKVRCKEKNRYYVFVDGLDVGQLCPTERIGVEMGPHTVEVYDPVTDSRRRFEINVTQTRLSSRVRVD